MRMNSLSRRNILKGIVSAPLLGSIKPNFGAAPDVVPIQTAPGTQPTVLNLVFHGLFAFVLWDQCLEVLVPNVGNEHIYKAGTLLPNDSSCRMLSNLKGATAYQLIGVTGDASKPFDASCNAVLTGLRIIDRSPSRLYCSFLLPHPQEIWSLRHVQVLTQPGANFFAGRAASQVKARELAMVQALVYRDIQYDTLNIDPAIGWKKQTTPSNTVNLHVFAEPASADVTPTSPDHPMTAVERLVRLFPGLDLHLVFSGVGSNNQEPLPAGMTDSDKNSFAEICAPPMHNAARAQSASLLGVNIHHCLSLVVNNLS